jgi:hypothetical protein
MNEAARRHRLHNDNGHYEAWMRGFMQRKQITLHPSTTVAQRLQIELRMRIDNHI